MTKDTVGRNITTRDTTFQTIFEQSPVSTQIFSPDGTLIKANKAWERLWGVRLADIKGYNILKDKQLIDIKIMPLVRKAFKGQTISFPPVRYEPNKTIKDVSRVDYRWTQSLMYPIKDKEGCVIKVVLQHEDITNYKRTEDNLKKSEERATETTNLLKTIIDTAPVGICLFDNQLKYQMINKMLADINGLPPEDHIGKSIQEVIPSLNGEVTKHLKHVLKTGEPIIGLELTGETRDEPGKRKHWREDYFPIRSVSGKIIGIGALVLDITERKQQEQQKDEFLGIASHELKTPVTSLKVFGQVLQNRFVKAGDTKSAGLLGKMDAQINKLTILIQDLLDISRIEGGRLQFHNQSFIFDELVDEVIEETQRTTQRHRLIREGAAKKKIYGDRDRIGQVITNFLTNAIKYSPHADNIVIHVSSDKKEIALGVEDFGVGMPKDTISRVFERFYRVKGKTHDTVPGMGLGLYIASEIVKRQGGRIWAKSDKGKGSTFCFALPVKGGKKIQQKNTFATEEMKHE